MAKYRLDTGPWLLPVLTALGVAIMLLLGLNAYSTLNERADQSREDRDTLAEDVRVLRDQVEDMGQTPEAPEPEERIAEDPPPPVVSDERLDAAVERFCGLPGCRGPRGFPGADSMVPGPPGRPPTQAEIRSEVAAFCAQRNDCVGAAGSAGRDGTDGADGSDGSDGAPGERGPGPTDEQIAEAVASFCAEGNCRGSDGADGDDGRDGEDGRGITEIRLESTGPRDCFLVFEFTAEPLEQRVEVSPLMCAGGSDDPG